MFILARAAAPKRTAAATIAYTSQSVQTTDTSTYTFSTMSVGDEAADRQIAVIVHGSAQPASVSSVTVGGVGASQIVRAAGSNEVTEIWLAAVPSGTSATIVVTWGASTDGCAIGVFAVYGADSAAHATITDTDSDPAAGTLDCPAGGVALGGTTVRDVNTTQAVTWSGLVEDYDATGITSAAVDGYSGASYAGAASISVSANVADSRTRNPVLAAASFGPA